MKPKKWLKQAAFILFDKKKNKHTFNIRAIDRRVLN